MKSKAANSGRSFNKVAYPAPEAAVIEADWPIAVEVGEERI